MAQTPDLAFSVMAERIKHNTGGAFGGTFGGACVIIPPTITGNEKPIELLMLDAHSDPAQFLSTVITRIQIMVREIEDEQRRAQGFGPR